MADQDEPKTECSSYEMKVITETFQMFDRDNSGVIDMKEMTNVLGALNVTNNDETIQMMFTNMDKVFSKFFISVFFFVCAFQRNVLIEECFRQGDTVLSDTLRA